MTDQPTPRLRLVQVIVTPVLMWDDGEELTPGPQLQPVTVPLSALAGLAESLPAEIAQIADQAAPSNVLSL
jgi:hypothetical protein